MKKVTIKPNILNGIAEVPPSKSFSHRALICGALAGEGTKIKNLGESDDIDATLHSLTALGFRFSQSENSFLVEERANETLTSIDCGESGSTLRFMIPLALVFLEDVTFIGHGRLMQRPLKPYFDIFDEYGISYKIEGEQLTLHGKLTPGEFHMPGNVSSQFISGLLMSLPLLGADSAIILDSPLESRAYIDITLDVMRRFGVRIEESENVFFIPGGQKYQPCTYTVEADFSQAAFFLVAGAIGGSVLCKNLTENSLQGDREILSVLARAGATITKTEGGILLSAAPLVPLQIDVSEIPDLFPVLSVLACFSEGESVLCNGARLRFKECDRLHAMAEELTKLGALVEEGEDYLKVNGTSSLKGGVVDAHNDHRIAMSLAICSQRCDSEVTITGSESVRKSMPDFWQRFQKIGGIFHECDMGE